MNCKNHPDTEVSGFCTKCGNFFCEECLIFAAGKNYCRNCLAEAVEKGENKKDQPQIIVQQQQQQTASSSSLDDIIIICCVILGIILGFAYLLPK